MPEIPLIGDPSRLDDDTPDNPELPQQRVKEDEDGGIEVQDMGDGGAMVTLDPETTVTEHPEFYANLADYLGPDEVENLVTDMLLKIEDDKLSRKKRDELYEEGIRRTGLGNDAPGGATFSGASRVVHPVLVKASIDFAARAAKELLPPDGPVRDKIVGTVTKDKVERARRKSRHMNWQLTEQMPEFYSEIEQLLTQLPLGGSQYLMLEYSEDERRPLATFIPIDEMIIPFSAANFRTALRQTWAEPITQETYEQRVESGMYRDVANNVPSQTPEPTAAETASEKVEGKESQHTNVDGARPIYRTWTNLRLSVDDTEDGQPRLLPYILHIDVDNRQLLGVYRNWSPKATIPKKLDWVVEFPFVPWRGALAIGLVHMIGGLTAAATGSLRALLDSAHINNMPTLIKLSGYNQGGQTMNLNPTEVKTVEGGINQDDIRKVMMNVPFNQPSPVLLELLGRLTAWAEDVVRTTFEDIADNSQQMPVGTTLALIEQGMTVFSSIHARLHRSMGQVLAVLHRINATYIDEQEVYDDTGELLVKRADYIGAQDVIPVSDPNIFSEVQRFAQMQVVAGRAAAMPGLYNMREVEKAILERSKIDEPQRFLLPAPETQETNAVTENMMILLGRPVAAYPDQDHLSHIKILLDFTMHPVFGANAAAGLKAMPAAVQHLIEHLGFWYVEEMVRTADQATGDDITGLMGSKDVEVNKSIDTLFAEISDDVLAQAGKTFSSVPAVIQRALQMIQQYQGLLGGMGQDPQQAAAMAETRRKAQADQMQHQRETQKIQQDPQLKLADIQSREKIAGAQLQSKAQDRAMNIHNRDTENQTQLQQTTIQETSETQRNDLDNQTELQQTAQDNATAITIAHMDNEVQKKANVSTGTKVGKD